MLRQGWQESWVAIGLVWDLVMMLFGGELASGDGGREEEREEKAQQQQHGRETGESLTGPLGACGLLRCETGPEGEKDLGGWVKQRRPKGRAAFSLCTLLFTLPDWG